MIHLPQMDPVSCLQAAAAAMGVGDQTADDSSSSSSLARIMQCLTAAAAVHPSCRAHASFSRSLWLQPNLPLQPHPSPPSSAPLPSLNHLQLQHLQSTSSLLLADARSRTAAAALRLRLLLSSSPNAIPPLPHLPPPPPPLSSTDALIRALAVTSKGMQDALHAVAPPLPSTKSTAAGTAGAKSRVSGGGGVGGGGGGGCSSALASSVRSHIMGSVPDRGGRPNDLNDRAVERDVSSANAALKGQVGSHAHTKGQHLPMKRQFQGGGRKR